MPAKLKSRPRCEISVVGNHGDLAGTNNVTKTPPCGPEPTNTAKGAGASERELHHRQHRRDDQRVGAETSQNGIRSVAVRAQGTSAAAK